MDVPGLRVLVVSPFAAHSGRGNAVTAARVARRLASAGARAEVVHANESFALGQALREAWPDVLVGIHAGHFSRALDVAGVRLGPDGVHFDGQTRHTPAIVLGLGGNELYEDLGVSPGDDERGHVRSASWALFERADAVLVASEYQYELAAERRPGGFFLVPRYPEIGFGPIEGLAEKLAALPPGPTLVWSGAFRHQKRPEWLAPILRLVAVRHPAVRLLVAGPPPTDGAGLALEAELLSLPGVLRVPSFHSGPGGSVGTLLAHANLTLNTSRTEGTSNFLLESMHESVPVVAAACASTKRWATGIAELFDSPEAGAEAISTLLEDSERARALGCRARTWLDGWASPERETEALVLALRAATEHASQRR